MISKVSIGDRILLLKGMHAGLEATVFKERGLDEDEFLVQFDDQGGNSSTRVSYKFDAFGHVPIDAPNWLCSLSIDDLWAVDDAALHAALIIGTGGSWYAGAILPLIASVRQRRLPVSADDLWLTLRSHGFSPILQQDFCRLFDFSIELLVSLNGRPPIKKKRVEAMSIGRY
jgi:hypothetical protein